MLWLPAASAARWGGFAAATAYAFFSGWGVPSQRTVWMLATVTLLQGAGLRWPWLLVLLASAVVVTALDPWALTQAGFWLSFAAVGLLMMSSPATGNIACRRRRSRAGAAGRPPLRHLRADLRTQVIATLGLTPLTLVFFQQVSIVGFAANLVAIPVVTLVITPLALLGTLLAPLWWLARRRGEALDALLTGSTAFPAPSGSCRSRRSGRSWRVCWPPPCRHAGALARQAARRPARTRAADAAARSCRRPAASTSSPPTSARARR